MGIFSKTKSKPEPKKPVEEKEKNVKTDETPAASTTAKPEVKSVLALVADPRVSEKASVLGSTGTYVFNVPTSANKVEVRKAVEKQYKVKVVRVNMIRGEGKVVRRGRIAGKRSNWKKALVTLKSGQKIELHPGV